MPQCLEGRRSNASFSTLLPESITGRWIARRKARVAAAVLAGEITLDIACTRYALTVEELEHWIAAFRRDGVAGLRAAPSKRTVCSKHQDRYVVASEGSMWMVVDREACRPAIVEDIALNGLMLSEASTLSETLNYLHWKLSRAAGASPGPMNQRSV